MTLILNMCLNRTLEELKRIGSGFGKTLLCGSERDAPGKGTMGGRRMNFVVWIVIALLTLQCGCMCYIAWSDHKTNRKINDWLERLEKRIKNK